MMPARPPARHSPPFRTLAVAALMLAGCDAPENRSYALEGGKALNLKWISEETKTVANGRTIGFVVATFDYPDWMDKPDRRPVAEQLCPMVLSEMGSPDQIEGAPLETVLIKYRETSFELAGIDFGSSSNFWVELNRGECVTQR